MATETDEKIEPVLDNVNDQWKFERFGKSNIFVTNEDTIMKRHFKKINWDLESEEDDSDYRKASIVHKLVRKSVPSKLVDGVSIAEISDFIEDRVLELFKKDKKTYFNEVNNDCGLASPVDISVNNVVVNDGYVVGDKRVLGEGDVVKICFSVHVNGAIVESGFTHIVTGDNSNNVENEIYHDLLEASKDATYSAIAVSGDDARLSEISEIIEEVISSYELPLDEVLDSLEVKPVQGFGGYLTDKYICNGCKFLFSSPDPETQGESKMREGEVYVVKTFATTGCGEPTQSNNTVGQCVKFEINRDTKNKKFLKKNMIYKVVKNRNGLPFSLRWYPKLLNDKKGAKDLKYGMRQDNIFFHPVLADIKNSRVAQFGHTIRVKDNCVEVYSIDNDY